MSSADYEKRGFGTITPSGTLAIGINESQETINISHYSSNDHADPIVDSGLMLGGEIMRVTSVAMPLIGVARGCADTIPAKHLFGDKVWFFTQATGSDNREYMATETIGVKLLMKSASSSMQIENSPPRTLVFNSRAARPYPPGLVLANGTPFYQTAVVFDSDDSTVDVTWKHRDRVVQGDTLQGHTIDNIGPEAGTTYRINVYDADGLEVRTATTADNHWSYDFADAVADLGEDVDGYLTLESLREGFASWQKYRIDFRTTGESLGGWGKLWGKKFGTA